MWFPSMKKILVAFSLFGALSAVANANCLKNDAVIAVSKQFNAWQVVTVNDLRPEDQKLWKQAHGEACPGYAEGNFQSGDRKSFAVTVFQKHPTLRQMLVVVNFKDKVPVITLLSKAQAVAYLSVVSQLPPGKYPAVDESAITLSRDSISYEAIEAGVLIFYFKNGTYRSISTEE